MQDTSVRQHAPIPAAIGQPMPAAFRDFLRQRSPGLLLAIVEPSSSCMKNSAEALPSCIEWDRAIVLSVARGVEPDADEVMRWFVSDAICELGGKTAQQLVEEGATAQLLDMLVTIRSGSRDG